ncbi:MAG: hypothetical protein HY821_24255 [Acidobacteria bacterium]|nr:hypothetical protein [Acidobacteriota bacterium]
MKTSDLQELMEHVAGSSVSIYLPTHRASVETRQDPIRLKNLIRDCEKNLESGSLRGPEIKQILDPIRALVDDYDFWQHQSDGLAIFRSRDLFRTYRVALKVPQLAVVADRFYSKPLLALITVDCRYFILALSHNEVRLYRATRDTVTEIEPAGMPHSLIESLGQNTVERGLQSHSKSRRSGSGTGSAPRAVVHGHGGGNEEKKDAILAFFRQVDASIRELLSQERAPLILAAVDHLCPLYRQANTYSELLNQWISGNPDGLSDHELHRRAEPIAELHFREDQQRAICRFLDLRHTQRTSDKLREILPAAHQGRIEVLFVALGVQLWGSFNLTTNEMAVLDQAAPDSQDLLNLAAVSSFLHGGKVYVLPPDLVPGNGQLAALFRY